MDENIKISDIGKREKKFSIRPMFGFEVKKHGVTIEFESNNVASVSTNVLTGVEVFRLEGDKKWKI